MNDAQTGNITGHNTIASALTNIVTGKEDANFSSPNGKYNFFTCSSNTLKCDEYAFNAYQRQHILFHQMKYHPCLTTLIRPHAFLLMPKYQSVPNL